MAIFMRAVLPDVTTEQYEALNEDLRNQPGDIFAGCLAHVCVPTGTGLEIYDLWESEEAMNKFATSMMPVAERRGMTAVSGGPQVMPVHRYWFPGQ
ncbi:hypothetical protein GCM10010271_44880 [Streptomyces kurssanovii]|nr:hypothetical protein GCM10010271_44880 [Streptomyces kurssanovii]